MANSKVSEVALLYIDNSNIFISAQQHSAQLFRFREGVVDIRRRIRIGELVEEACGNKKLLRGRLYGSEPPPTDSVWKAIKRHEIEVILSKKNSNYQEKETDTGLCVDATTDLIEFPMDKELVPVGATKYFILFTGDRDMRPLVEAAHKKQWVVHLWSFRCNMSAQYRKIDGGLIEITYIDDYFEKITFTNIWWKKPIPKERSMVLTFSNSPGSWPDHERRSFVTKVVHHASLIFGVPCQGKFFTDSSTNDDNTINEGHEDEEPNMSGLDTSNFVLVLCPEETFLTRKNETRTCYDFNTDIWPKALDQLPKLPNYVGIQTYQEFLSLRYGNVGQMMNPQCIMMSNEFHMLQTREMMVAPAMGVFENMIPPVVGAGVDFAGNNGEGPYETVRRKRQKSYTKYSALCPFNFACKKHLTCPNTHTDQETEYFKLHRQVSVHFRRYYKFKLCDKGDRCTHILKSYLCPFAHGEHELRTSA